MLQRPWVALALPRNCRRTTIATALVGHAASDAVAIVHPRAAARWAAQLAPCPEQFEAGTAASSGSKQTMLTRSSASAAPRAFAATRDWPGCARALRILQRPGKSRTPRGQI